MVVGLAQPRKKIDIHDITLKEKVQYQEQQRQKESEEETDRRNNRSY